jgi:DNA gyrase subunit A
MVMDLGLVRKVDIEEEMQQSYLDYAMSTIVARALPDARDGLKPVQRRILYAMYDMGIRADSPYKKSARIVGEVLGKYHPHGDTAVYEAMARMAQDFSMRNMLIDGQGNFGSVDGDEPAAMRYTEARLKPVAIEMLGQIDRNTVDFIPNFDGSLEEPLVLPAAVPNMLVNGGTGIAVGMATNIPPHNLGEVIDALIYTLKEWTRLDDINISDLMKFIKGPDFPTGGIIILEGEENVLLSAYATGRGKLNVRGKVMMEEMVKGRSRLIITELPYMTNKSALIERIADLVREGTLEGIADLRDESDKQGMRIVIELNKNADGEKILRDLYQRTPLQSTFGINMVALVDGEPRLLTLKQALKVYLEHRLEVVKRRSEYDLERAKQRLHILEGLRVALNHLDEIIALIRNSPDTEQARARLMKRYRLSEIQAQAILDMALKRLAALERKKIELEYKETVALIKELESLLKSPKKMRQVVEDELNEIKLKYADRRRTQIVALKKGKSAKELLVVSELTPEKPLWVGLMPNGVIARTMNEDLPRISGRASPSMVVKTSTHQTLYLVQGDGMAAAVAVESIPEAESFGEGISVEKVAPLPDPDSVVAMFTVPQTGRKNGDAFIVSATRNGMVKKSALSELPGPAAHAFTLMRVNSGDELGFILFSNGNDEWLLFTAMGMAIRFKEDDVRPMGLVAGGVNAIKLAEKDLIIGMEVFSEKGEVLLIAEDGNAWRLSMNDFPLQGRYGQGVIACRLSKQNTLSVCLDGSSSSTGIIQFRNAAAKIVKISDIPQGKRPYSGKPIVEVKKDDEVIDQTKIRDCFQVFSSRTRSKKKSEQGNV